MPDGVVLGQGCGVWDERSPPGQVLVDNREGFLLR